MLQRISIENYRCLKRIAVPLRPLTVLIGSNDTGKSTFLNAVLALADTSVKIERKDIWRREKDNVQLVGTMDGGTISRCRPESVSDQSAMRQFVTPARLFELPAQGIATECEGFKESEQLDVATDGARVAALLDYLLRKDRNRFFSVIESLKKFVPGLEDLDIETPSPESRRIDFVIEQGLRIPAASASAGVRLILFFVALAHHPKPPKLILLEEPENGVHPKRLGEIIGLLREITEGKHGQHAAQVILTTHSPYLLDHIDVERDQVLVFRRNDDGSRTAEPADQERLKNFLDEFMLGEVWYNESEEGLVARS